MENRYEVIYGRLGSEPELKYTKNLKPVCNLNMAINSGEDEQTIWRRVVVWGKQAEACDVLLKKGNEVFVQGRIKERSYKDKDGNDKTVEEFNARLVGFPNC